MWMAGSVIVKDGWSENISRGSISQRWECTVCLGNLETQSGSDMCVYQSLSLGVCLETQITPRWNLFLS